MLFKPRDRTRAPLLRRCWLSWPTRSSRWSSFKAPLADMSGSCSLDAGWSGSFSRST